MAENSKIEWTDHTFNPWMGCTKVSPACTNCYAERDMDKRLNKVAWGPTGTRVKTTKANWQKPLKWNQEAEKSGIRRRVFCASLADVFEDWEGPIHNHRDEVLTLHGMVASPLLDYRLRMGELRRDLFELIDQTPNLDWLLLTKRPENIQDMWLGGRRMNVWLGTSVENQEYADRRIPELVNCRDLASVLFLSCEPLLGPLNFRCVEIDSNGRQAFPFIDWVIAGGESGPNARPSHPDWFRSLRDQCITHEIPFLFKQWGEWLPMMQFPPGSYDLCGLQTVGPPNDFQARVGKKKAGRLLDGVEWSQFPAVLR